MLTIKDWMELTEYRITNSEIYGWDCFGPTAHCFDSWNGKHDDGGWSMCIVFDIKDQCVYEVSVCDFQRNRAYKIINTDFESAYRTRLGDKSDLAWDDVKYTQLETDTDFVEKAQAIIAGEEYDNRIQIPVDFSDKELLTYMKLAHERDITFNQFVIEALLALIEDIKHDPEGVKARTELWKTQQQHKDVE